MDRALKEYDRAIKELDEQIEWRNKAVVAALPTLRRYVDELRTTIGVRQQTRMTTEQSLFVAACSADHRDISLNF